MLIDVPPTGPPRPLRWTCRLFHMAGDFGLFEGRRAALIDGVLYEEGPEPPPHACVRGLTADIFYRAFAGCFLRQRQPLALSATTDPVPDVSVVAGRPRDYAAAHPTTAVFVVEVAEVSLDFDTVTKLPLYAAANIPDYWIVDIASRRLLVFRDPAPIPDGGAAYRTHRTLGPADTVSPHAAPSAAVTVADLLP